MRKLVFIILTFLLSSSFVFANDAIPFNKVDSLEKNPLFGSRPWEQELQDNKKEHEQNISEECIKKEAELIQKEKLVKKRKLEAKRKREEAKRAAEEARKQAEIEERKAKRWEYFENKDYKVNQSSSAKEKAAALIEYAKDHLGCRYVYGGSSWKSGVDCSGYTMLCYGKFGVKLPHYSEDQAHYGKNVPSLSKAAPGDLICYYGHVGIYLGKNKMIHASNPRSGVKITYGVNYRKIKCIRRLFC